MVTRKNIHIYLLILLCSVFFISHTLYVLKTSQFPVWDEAVYILSSLQFYDMWITPTFDLPFRLEAVLDVRQPFYPFLISLPLLLFGTNYVYSIALLINGIFYSLTIAGIYFLGRSFFSKTMSLLASLIFACYGFPLFYLHFTHTETVATAFVTMSLLFLQRSQLFTLRKETILFALMFAAAFLTRWTTPVFLLGPLFFVLYLAITKKEKKKSYRFKNIGLFLLIGIILPFLLYYLHVLDDFMIYFRSGTGNAKDWVSTLSYLPQGLENPFSIHSMMFYFNILSQQTIYFFVLFGISFLLTLLRWKKYLFLLLAFLVPYCFFTFIVVFKDDRFIVPMYPAFALISVIPFTLIKNRRFQFVTIGVTVVIATLNFLGSSWGIGPMGQRGLYDIVTPRFIPHPRRIYLTSMVWPPRVSGNGEKLLDYIVSLEKNERKKSLVFLNIYMSGQIDGEMEREAHYERRELSRFVSSAQRKRLQDIQKGDYKTFFEMLRDADMLVLKQPNPIPEDQKGNEKTFMLTQFHQAISKNDILKAFNEIQRIPVPYDESELIVYKKIRKINQDEWEALTEKLIKQNSEEAEKIRQASLIITTQK